MACEEADRTADEKEFLEKQEKVRKLNRTANDGYGVEP